MAATSPQRGGEWGGVPLNKSGAVYENVRWTFESEQGRYSDWGLRRMGFHGNP